MHKPQIWRADCRLKTMRQVTSKKYHSKLLDNNILTTLYSEISPLSVSVQVMWNLTWPYVSTFSPACHVFSSTMKTPSRQRLPSSLCHCSCETQALAYPACQFVSKDEDQIASKLTIKFLVCIWAAHAPPCVHLGMPSNILGHKSISGVISGSSTN